MTYVFKQADNTTNGAIKWEGGNTPTTPANGETDILQFFTIDGGVTYYGIRSIDAAG